MIVDRLLITFLNVKKKIQNFKNRLVCIFPCNSFPFPAKGSSALKILKSTKEFSNCTKLIFGNNNPCWVITCDISWILLEKSLAVVEKKHSEFFVSLGAKVLYNGVLKENPKNGL